MLTERVPATPGHRQIEGSRGRVVSLVWGTLVSWALLGGTAAQAQTADTTAAGDTIRPLRHAEIVVRALRAPVRPELLPYAVTVRRPDLGVPTAGRTLANQLQAIPGLQVHSRYNDALGDRIVMRGFGARSQFGVRGIQVLVDGIPATMPDGQSTLNHLDLELIERAEVVRGPAAAAYGNAAGGVLLLHTRPPPDRRFRQEVTAAGGTGSLLRLRSTTGGSTGSAGWIASVSGERRDGYRPHSETDRYQLTGRLDTRLAGGFLRAVAHGVSYDAENPGSLTLDQFQTDPFQAQAFNVAQRTGETGRHGQLGLVWERPLEVGDLEATLYGIHRSLDNPIPPTIIELERSAGGARALLSRAGEERGDPAWAVGLDAAVQRDDRQNFDNVDGGRGDLTLDQTERVTNLAAHGQLLVPLLDRLGLFLGGRYDRISFSADDDLVTAGNPDDSGDRTMDALSPTAGLRFDLSSRVRLFGNISTAFETPTTTELVNRPDGSGGFNRELEPQRTVSYEVGGRAEAAPGLSFEASVYHARVDDALVPFEVAAMPGRQFFRNAGAAVHQGIELLGELRTPRLDVLASFSRTDAEFQNYDTGGVSYAGNTVPGVRPWTVGLVVIARPADRLAVQLEYQGVGEMVVDDANTVEAPGYQLFGLRVGARDVTLAGVRVRPFGGVENLLDESYVSSVVPNAFGQRFFEPGPGRSFYLGLETALVLP